MKFIIDVTEQIKVKHDTVNLVISVNGHADNLNVATKEGLATLASINAVFEKFNVLNKAKVSRLNTRKDWKRVERRVKNRTEYLSEPNGFVYSSVVHYSSLISDSNIEEVYNALKELHRSDMSIDISFSVSNLDDAMDTLLKELIVKADHKAEVVALARTGSLEYTLDKMNTSSSNTYALRASNCYAVDNSVDDADFNDAFDLDNLGEQLVSLSGTFEYTIK